MTVSVQKIVIVCEKKCQTTNSGTPQVVILCCRVTREDRQMERNKSDSASIQKVGKR